jgi:dethiobiotin synthetase
MTTSLFITATGTGVGKTFISRGLARALTARGGRVAALKPLETGCVDGHADDATALAHAARRPELATAAGFYRATLPAAPYAAHLAGETVVPPTDALVKAIRDASAGASYTLVEGAGGLLVPLDATRTTADLIRALGIPALVIAPDTLGVLSHVFTLTHTADVLGIPLAAIVLSQHGPGDASRATNARILAERLPIPVYVIPPTAHDDDALAKAVTTAGLVRLFD